jgi:hypothetical protein
VCKINGGKKMGKQGIKADDIARLDARIEVNVMSDREVKSARNIVVLEALRSAIRIFFETEGVYPTQALVAYGTRDYANLAVSETTGKYVSSEDIVVVDGVKIRYDCTLKDNQIMISQWDGEELPREFTGRLRDVVTNDEPAA